MCGVRGWTWPSQPEYDQGRDEKHWRRAVLRLQTSLHALRSQTWDVAVAMFHYPPCSDVAQSELCRMVAEAGVSHCVYGHLHGESLAGAFEGERNGVHYRCVSADHVGFRPRLLFTI